MPIVSLIIKVGYFLRYSGRIDEFCHVPLSYTSNYKATPSLKVQNIHMIKSRKQNFIDENFLKVPV